jgi:two-component system chemotaxis response regulator CheB
MRALLEALSPEPQAPTAARPTPRLLIPPAPPKVVGIGSSTGGPAALATIIPALPRDLPVPVLVVQHMPPIFTASLAEMLARKSALRVVEAADGDALAPGVVYLAPGGRQLRVRVANAQSFVELTDDPPEHHCRPAVDYLFRSLAQGFRDAAMGVILTGMGKDGTLGLRLMKRHGSYVIGQNAASCTVYGMPREAMEAGVVDLELRADQIAPAIVAAVTRRGRG